MQEATTFHYSKSKISSAGRFAPSPSGPLHLGSLAAAVGSYMIAKQRQAKWLVRIEDLDPPREVQGATKSILKSLEDFGLYWDGEVVYQSERSERYQQRLMELEALSIVYPCICSRKQIEERNQGIYDGFCRNSNYDLSRDHSIRIRFNQQFKTFKDKILGNCVFDDQEDLQDFIVKRRDGLFAYQLAVVVDDIDQQIDHVVRGADILDSTPRQNFLYSCFSEHSPDYYHLPLVTDKEGIKFSKRSGAKGIDKKDAINLLLGVFEHLNQEIDSGLYYASVDEIIRHFEINWCTQKIVECNRYRLNS